MRNFVLVCVGMISSITIFGQEYNGFDSDGKRHGKWKKRYENTEKIRYEGTFEHGKEVGEFKFYKLSSEGQPTAIKLFSKNDDTVRVKYFTSKGKILSEGGMIGKNRVGKWIYYHQNSKKIMMEEFYTDGKLNGDQLTYFDNGKLTEKTTFVNGKREGHRFVYSEEGIVFKKFTYENDQLHGLTQYYDTKGNLIIEGNYKRDRKNGIWKYYKDGKLDEQVLFPKQNRDSN